MPAISIFLRVFVAPAEQEAAVSFYEQVLGAPRRPAMCAAGLGLRIVPVGTVLVMAGDEAALAPVRRTSATVLVSSLAAAVDELVAAGASIERQPTESGTLTTDDGVPVVRATNAFAVHPDGLVVEYVQHGPVG